jgi:hypothetical protein
VKISYHDESKVVGERMFLDLYSIKPPNNGVKSPKSRCIMLVDEAVNMKISHWFAKNNDMVEPTFELIKMLKNKGIVVKVIRLDNAGESMLLDKRCKSKDWKIDITFEFSARATPQHNHLMELGLAEINKKGRAILIRADVPFKCRFHLCTEAFTTATDLDGLSVVELNGERATLYEHFL